MKVKRCSRCRQDLPLSQFGRNCSRPDGRQHRCRRCLREGHAEWRRDQRLQDRKRRLWERDTKTGGEIEMTDREQFCRGYRDGDHGSQRAMDREAYLAGFDAGEAAQIAGRAGSAVEAWEAYEEERE